MTARRICALALAFCAACALTIGLPSVGRAAPPSPTTGPALPLGHAGRWITDAQGRVVVLHGTNMVYKLPPYYPQAIGFGNDDAAFLQRLGFNAVRVGVIWTAVEPQPGVFDDAYLGHIAATVATLARHGIVSLLDFHQDMYNELFQGEGFPDWSVEDDGLLPQPQEGFDRNYLVMPALQHAFDHFWENSPGPGGVGLQDRFAAAWRHVAERFRGNAHVLGYELMNEPWPGTDWEPCAEPTGCPLFDATLTTFYQRVVAAIRSVDRRTLIWYEPNVLFNFGADTHLGSIGDPRAGFAFHDYCLDPNGPAASCQTAANLDISNALKHVARTGDAVLMSEFGDPSYSLMSAMVQRDDRNMIPWLEWSYCPCHDPTGAASKNAFIWNPESPPAGKNLNLPGLRTLVEPYPQVIAGTPLSWRFDSSTRTFRLRYSTARASHRGRFAAGSLTDVAAPKFVYGRGYGAAVSGGAIVSRRGAGVLEIAACRGAKTISVTVSPSSRSQSSCGPPARAARRRGSR